MQTEQLLGILLVALAGLFIGSGAWPMKIMKLFQYEHWAFLGNFTGLIIIPWLVTLIFCPGFLDAYASLPVSTLIASNLCAIGWGIANVLCGLCLVRIGVALTGAILTGLGVSLGVTLPMIVKGSGLFKDAANVNSPAGLTVLAGVGVMLVGVVFASVAGFGRDRVLKKLERHTGSFLGGLIMTVIAGFLSCGLSLAFVYSQGPVVEAMKARGAGEIAANFSVWAVALIGGSLINILYPAWLMTKNKSWGVLARSWKEIVLSVIMGVNFAVGMVLMGKGMVFMGALGASVGFGIQQAAQMIGGQGLGFISGEWKGVTGSPRKFMVAAIAILIMAALVMAYGNTLAKQ